MPSLLGVVAQDRGCVLFRNSVLQSPLRQRPGLPVEARVDLEHISRPPLALDSIVWAPVDAVRRSLLRALGPAVRPLILDRHLRVTVLGVGIVAFTLASTSLFPLWVLALGPVLIGAPHLVGDIRYLVVRPGLHRKLSFWGAIGVPLALAYFVPGPRLGMLAVAGGLLISRAPMGRRLLGLGVWAAAYALLLKLGRIGTISVLHLHNLLTLGIWWMWRPRNWGKESWVLIAFVGASVLILCGATLPLVRWADGLRAPRSSLSFEGLARSLLPFKSPGFGVRLLIWYGFAQAVHYSTWIRLVPEDDRARATPRTFAASWRALREDFTSWGLAAVVIAVMGLAVWAAFDLRAAHRGYTRAATFHFDLEFAILALCWAERHRPGWRADPANLAGLPRQSEFRSPSGTKDEKCEAS
jgi:hypothetical protein